MKVFIPVFAICLLTITRTYAQAPQAFNYQAVARDEAGNLIVDQAISVKISLLDGSATGTVLYEETHQDTTDAFGAFSLAIGQGTPVTGTFSSIDWSSGAKFLQVSLDPEGGDNFVDVGTTQLLSVPYALYAENSVWTRNGDDIFYNQGLVGIGNENPEFALDIHSNSRAFTRYTTDESGNVQTNDGFIVGYTFDQAWLKNGENTPLILFTSDIPRMIISGDGKVSIGSHSPTHELHMIHKSKADGGASAGLKIQNEGNNDNWWALYTANGSGQFELYYKGTIKGKFKPSDGTYEKGSDARLKRAIEPLTPTLQKVLELTPRTYYFKDDENLTSRSLGFIAQEVQPIFPELVGYAGEEQDIMTLNYDGFGVLAIKAIQEQQAEIERNKYLIDQLRKRITMLEGKKAE
jgi:hypothetical protein